MNTFFSIQRFLYISKREFIEGRQQWLRWWGILAVIMFVIHFIGPGGLQQFIFFLVTAVASSQFIQGISDRQKRVFYLTIPATPMEKLLSRYLYITSLIFVAFPLAILTAKVGQQLVSHFIFHSPFDWSMDHYIPADKNYFNLILSFFTVQVIFMFGSMIWLKNPLLKTTLFHALYVTVSTVLLATIFYNFLKDSSFERTDVNLWEDANQWMTNLVYGIHIAMIVFFYVLCYFRFRELGIVHKTFPLSPTTKMILGCYVLLFASVLILSIVALRYNFVTGNSTIINL